MRKGRSQKMGTAFSHGRESGGPKPFGPGAGWQRLPGVQRAAPLPGIKRAAPVGRGRGGSACADAREGLARSPEAERSGPVKCRKRSGPEGSTLCTGYYPSKTGGFRGMQPAAKVTITTPTRKGGESMKDRVKDDGSDLSFGDEPFARSTVFRWVPNSPSCIECLLRPRDSL